MNNMNSGYGLLEMVRLHINLPVMGKVLLVCPTSDANYDRYAQMVKPDSTGDATQIRLYTTLELAYAAATSNQNDVILLSGNSTHSVAAGIAWTKSRIHVIGLDGGERLVQQGAKVQGASTSAYVIKVTGTRNTFRNIKFIQGGATGTSLNVLQEGAEGSLYKNCSFVFSTAANLDETTSSEVLAGSDSATFIECMFGSDTLLTSAARTVFKIDQVTASQEFKSNVLKDCIFIMSSSDADAMFISMAAAGDILFTNLLINPIFQASVDTAGGAATTKAVSTANGTTKGTLNLYNPCAFNVANIGVNGTNNDGLQVYGAANTGTDLMGIAPVAT